MSKRSLAVVVLFAAVILPAAVHAANAPLPPDQLEAILAGEGLPCSHVCYVERDCNCDPPVIVSCTGCRTCNLVPFGVKCDGVVHSCPPCAQW